MKCEPIKSDNRDAYLEKGRWNVNGKGKKVFYIF